MNFSDPLGLCPECLLTSFVINHPAAAEAVAQFGQNVVRGAAIWSGGPSCSGSGCKTGAFLGALGFLRPLGGLAGAAAAGASEVDGIVGAAARGTGNFGVGVASAEDAAAAGSAWVGDGARVASDGKTLVSGNGLRQYRPPTFKPNMGVVQANFESRAVAKGPWDNNGHLTVLVQQSPP